MVEGDNRHLGQLMLLSMRVAGHPETPPGPAWPQDATRDMAAPGSVTLLGWLVLAVILFLLLACRHGPGPFVAQAITGVRSPPACSNRASIAPARSCFRTVT
ncbi:hypothetical protein [Dyella sp.]|uniref:hypothetical protein n=1 Tax=Dyella sp. TaxID=1869338 RepID=UPI002D79CC59|nr:hypothetical protein [Dyella sp.]HET6432148.1 hypothetical protein [Dyella sp.]